MNTSTRWHMAHVRASRRAFTIIEVIVIVVILGVLAAVIAPRFLSRIGQSRTAVAKSNILVNSPNETKYFYQDLDSSGTRLNNANKYTVTFPKDGTPPVHGFWSLSIYNEHHFFIANPINRFSVGTKNKDLKHNADGSLTICVQTDEPKDPIQRANWLPAPKGDFSLYVRAYWPKPAVTDGSWTPPPVVKAN